MEKNRKELKSFSLLILLIVALELIRNIVTACVNGIPEIKEIPEVMTKDMVNAVAVVVFVLTFVVFIPQIYVGIKGIKIANGAESGKAHIIWAVILMIFAGISVITGISALTKAVSFDAVMDLVGPAVDFIVFAFYFVYARRVANGN